MRNKRLPHPFGRTGTGQAMGAAIQNIRIRHENGYRFSVDFGDAFPGLTVDEPAPIGKGEGPSPEQLLLAGVTNCLCASLFFALTKYRQKAEGIAADAACTVDRNEHGRLRIVGMEVRISLPDAAGDLGDGAERAFRQFEDFCTVSESVRAGIPVAVTIEDKDGTVVHTGRTGDRDA
jgi:organic hydroperoxide reductase OsmC/OhrA